MSEQPGVETAAGREPALEALGRQSAAVFAGDELAQLFGMHGAEVVETLRGGPLREGIEIATVGVERMRGHAPLDLQVGEKPVDIGCRVHAP